MTAPEPPADLSARPPGAAPPAGTSLFAAFLVGGSIVFNNGGYHEGSLAFLLVALLLLGWQFFSAVRRDASPVAAAPTGGVAVVVWIVLCAMVWQGITDIHLLLYPKGSWLVGRVVQVGFLALLATYLPFLGGRRESVCLVRVRFALFAAATLTAAIAALHASPSPVIDAFTLQVDGADWLLSGQNPYRAVSVPSTGTAEWAPPQLSYGYPPTQIYVTTIAELVTGDVRAAMAVALVAAGVFLRLLAARRAGTGAGRVPSLMVDAPALALWLAPKTFFIVEQSWTDPVPLALLLGAVVAVDRGRSMTGAVLWGLALSSKQTMIWFLPLTWLLPGFRRRHVLLALAVAVATVAPFLAWHPAAVLRSLGETHVHLPLHPGGLTFNNWLLRRFGWGPSGWIAFLLAAAVVAVALGRLRRSLLAVGLASAFAYLVFFAFNRWAFANYYFFVSGLAALAAACAGRVDAGATAPPDPLPVRERATV
jgi:hypothetical protein